MKIQQELRGISTALTFGASDSRLLGLMERVEAAEAISFDLFDTLFVRPLADPEDLFDVLGERYDIPDFRKLRRLAQAESFRRMRAEGRNEITLQSIYESFNNPDVATEQLRQSEYELELDIVSPNREMVEIFNQALVLGKKVAITSDMYLPLSFFEELLDRHGMQQVPMFISSDRNATKRDHGALFDMLAAELGVSHERILHIGDNPVSDIARASERGLATWHYRERRLPKRRNSESPSTSIARALIRVHQDAVPLDTFHELGFLKAGPAALGFLNWIEAEAQRDNVDHILFVSRDGHVLRSLAQLCWTDAAAPQPPKFSYLLGSRVSFALAAMDEANFNQYVPFLLSGAEGLSPSELLDRVGVPCPAEHVMYDLRLDQRRRFRSAHAELERKFLQAWKWEILKVCRRNRRGLLRHLLDLGVQPGQRVAFVDIGWSGTTQETFDAAIERLMPLDVFGYYFCLTDSVDCRRRQKAMRMKALISSDTVSGKLLQAVYANRVAAEIFFSAPHGAVIGYSEGPKGVLPVEDFGRADSSGLADAVRQIEAGVINFANRFRPMQGGLRLRSSPLEMVMPLLEFMADGRWADHPLLSGIKNFDAWASSRGRDMWLKDYAVSGYLPA